MRTASLGVGLQASCTVRETSEYSATVLPNCNVASQLSNRGEDRLCGDESEGISERLPSANSAEGRTEVADFLRTSASRGHRDASSWSVKQVRFSRPRRNQYSCHVVIASEFVRLDGVRAKRNLYLAER